MMNEHERFMRRAFSLAQNGIDSNAGGPFGAVIVKSGEIIGEGWNRVTSTNDPTAHAEIIAIRNACKEMRSFQLDACVLYTSCEPCPMCLGAIYWARPEKIFFACTREDAAAAGFDDQFIYEEIDRDFENRRIETVSFMREDGLSVFESWAGKDDKMAY